MPLSEIAIALIMLLCVAGFLNITTKIQKHCDKEIARLQSHITDLERDFFAVSGTCADLETELDKMRQKLSEKEDILSEQAKEIQKWNEGISNIMNYSLDVAKGGDRR